MATFPANISSLQAHHLQALVDGGAAEDRTLEFKAMAYGPMGDDGREFLKDVTALAKCI